MILPIWPSNDERPRQTSPMCGRYTLKSRAEIIAETFGIAALRDRWAKQGEPIESCTILTCEANEPMMAIHERMPVVIPPESFGVWLSPAERDVTKLSKLPRPFHPDEMTAYPVSTLVNNVKQDSAARPVCVASSTSGVNQKLVSRPDGTRGRASAIPHGRRIKKRKGPSQKAVGVMPDCRWLRSTACTLQGGGTGSRLSARRAGLGLSQHAVKSCPICSAPAQPEGIRLDPPETAPPEPGQGRGLPVRRGAGLREQSRPRSIRLRRIGGRRSAADIQRAEANVRRRGMANPTSGCFGTGDTESRAMAASGSGLRVALPGHIGRGRRGRRRTLDERVAAAATARICKTAQRRPLPPPKPVLHQSQIRSSRLASQGP